MWTLSIFAVLIFKVDAQIGRNPHLQPYDNGHGWNIRLAVPGEPGNDYPTLATIPRTSFSCSGREPGYYADLETNCQVFRVCTVGATYGFQSFLCPNGTLFNQAVFVCDWWMNVKCEISEELLKSNRDQFDNLKLGPELMKDIKKMLTHPKWNPYDKNGMRSKFIVMQDYKPPSGQLFPNGALLASADRAPSRIYLPTKAIQEAIRQNYNRPSNIAFAASTPSPQYIPPTFHTFKPTTVSNVEILERLQLDSQKTQNTQNNYTPNLQPLQREIPVYNGHVGQTPQRETIDDNYGYRNEPINRQLENYNNYVKLQQTETINPKISVNKQQLQLNEQNFPQNERLTQYTQVKLQPASKSTQSSISSNNIGQTGTITKQNLVSNDIIPPTILTKTLAYSRLIQESKQGIPKSRITFKTWVLKPNKNAKLVVDPTTNTSAKSNSIKERYTDNNPYNYNTHSLNVRLNSQQNFPETDFEDYAYNTPTMPTKQTAFTEIEIPRSHLAPTVATPFNTLSARFIPRSNTPRPTQASQLHLAPLTFEPDDRYYLPPSVTRSNFEKIPNNSPQQPTFYQNARFVTNSPSPPADLTTSHIVSDINKQLSRSERIKDYKEYDKFADILDKEKLDITINNVVNDTDEIFDKNSPNILSEYRQITDKNNPDLYNLTAEPIKENLENIPVQSPNIQISEPSRELMPPIESYYKTYYKSNQLLNLPFFKKAVLPTIERTVSLKISIPENLADYLFKRNKDSNLEILNTGSNNYLVLMNRIPGRMGLIPLGKLSWNTNSNLSNSQALAFSLLADSINAAKKYNNILKDNIALSTPTQTQQFQDINNEELERISNSITPLTVSQYSRSNNSNNVHIVPLQAVNPHQSNYNLRKLPNQLNGIQSKLTQLQSQPHEQQFTSHDTNNSSNIIDFDIQKNSNIYSGQLYQLTVPEVTNKIINFQNSANPNSIQQTYLDKIKTQRIVNSKNSATKTLSETNPDIEIFKSQGSEIPIAKLRSPYSKEEGNGTQFLFNNILNDGQSIIAQLQDKIVGTLPYPVKENKFITYKKDEVYNLNTDLKQKDVRPNTYSQFMQNRAVPEIFNFQFIPTLSYEIDDERDQQRVLQTFQLNEVGSPKESNWANINSDNSFTKNFYAMNGLTIRQPTLARQREHNYVNTLYNGPSSYSAPQLSIGKLMSTQNIPNNRNFNSKIEEFDENNNINGYPKENTSPQYSIF